MMVLMKYKCVLHLNIIILVIKFTECKADNTFLLSQRDSEFIKITPHSNAAEKTKVDPLERSSLKTLTKILNISSKQKTRDNNKQVTINRFKQNGDEKVPNQEIDKNENGTTKIKVLNEYQDDYFPRTLIRISNKMDQGHSSFSPPKAPEYFASQLREIDVAKADKTKEKLFPVRLPWAIKPVYIISNKRSENNKMNINSNNGANENSRLNGNFASSHRHMVESLCKSHILNTGYKKDWFHLNVVYSGKKGGDELPGTNCAPNYMKTPSPQHQQAHVPHTIHFERRIHNIPLATRREEITTVKYPPENVNNIPVFKHQNKYLLTRQFNADKTPLFSNVENNRNVEAEYVKNMNRMHYIPRLNLRGIRRPRINHINVLVSSSMLVKER